MYVGNSYKVSGLLDDPHSGVNWYCEPHVSSCFSVDGSEVNVNSCFRHRNCVRFSTSGKSFVHFTNSRALPSAHVYL